MFTSLSTQTTTFVLHILMLYLSSVTSNLTLHARILLQDTLLRFYDLCPRYQREVKRNDSALAQVSAFKNSSLMVNEAANMKRSLGLADDEVTLDPEDLSAIYTACA